MILKNGLVMDENFRLKRLDIRIDGDRITEMGECSNGHEGIDMSGKYILPGFVDTHIHGACGVRISDSEPDLKRMTRFEATQGVTSIAITTACSEFLDLLRQIDVIRNFVGEGNGAKIAGIHAEGPFISKTYKGAMNPDHIIPADTDKLAEMIDRSGGLLKIITIAPEHEGSMELIAYAAQKGLTVSMGHTNADFVQAQAAIEAGATQLTHTFNAMRAINHREPGVLGAAFVHADVVCEMICDYVHLHPATVQMIYKLKGADRIKIISDSGRAAGMDISVFEDEGLMRYVRDGVVRLADGTIAGSAKTMADGVKNLILSGIPIEDVSKMASFNPAKSLKAEKTIGAVSKGRKADLAVLDENYDVVYTYIDGKCVYSKEANR